jgi:putative transposase
MVSKLSGTLVIVRVMKRSAVGTVYRTAVVAVRLTGADYRLAHTAHHVAGRLWSHGIAGVRQFWRAHGRDPDLNEIRDVLAGADAELLALHAHSRQAIADDIVDAIATYRANRARGRAGRARAPWRDKAYRPLTFTRGFGWRLDADNSDRFWLSLGRGRPRIALRVPQVIDSATGQPVAPQRWGEIRLCWNRDARTHELHIAYPSAATVPGLDPDRVVAIDEGIINPMTLATATSTAIEVTVINGRHARALKHRRNTAVAALRKRMAKCTKGSRQWRRYDTALRRANHTASAGLRNLDHQVSRKAADMIITANAGRVSIGDVRGIERHTAQAERRRAGRHQRRRLSQWSRGRQERYLAEKTGVTAEHIDEAYSSRTCPACLQINRPAGRHYRCRACQFACHRDAVGAINILMRTRHGAYTRIDPSRTIRVTYLRATPLTAARRDRCGTEYSPEPGHHQHRLVA